VSIFNRLFLSLLLSFLTKQGGEGNKICATFAHNLVEKFETIATTEKNAKARLFPFCLFFPKKIFLPQIIVLVSGLAQGRGF
jgi:hypothetical protein